MPWRRAVRAAFASPATVLVAVVAGLVVAFISAATVFHVSAAGSAAVRHINENRCADDTGLVSYSLLGRGGAQYPDRDWISPNRPALLDAARQRGFDVFRRTRYSGDPMTDHRGPVNARLVARDGAMERMQPLTGGRGEGAWIPDYLARAYGLEVGTVLTLHSPAGALAVPVVAIYRGFGDPIDPYWCSQRTDVVPNKSVIGELPAAVLVTPESMDRLVVGGLTVGIDRLEVTATGLPADSTSAARFAAQVAAFAGDVERFASPVARPGEPSWARPVRTVHNRADHPATTAARVQRSVGLSLLPLTGLSLLVGLGAVTGLAGQWVQRRFAEVRLLWSRGASPTSLGVKAVLELALPLAVGCVLGLAVARLTVPVFAPAAELDRWAGRLAAGVSAAGLLACLLVLLVTVALRVRRSFQAPVVATRRVRALRWVPWEAGVIGLAALCWQRLAGGALVVQPQQLPRVDAVALLFPLLCLLVLVGLALRLATLGITLSHRWRGWRAPALLWAVRRTAAQRRLAGALLVVAGLAVGAVAIGSGMSGTERRAVSDKGSLFTGSDTAVRVSAASPREWVRLPASLAGSATVVAVRDVPIKGTSNHSGRVLVVDRSSFSGAVTWRAPWGGDLGELLDRLGPAGSDGRVPALRLGGSPTDRFDLMGLPPLAMVGEVEAFPGHGNLYGLVVISGEALTEQQLQSYTQYVWSRRDIGATVEALTGAGVTSYGADAAAASVDALPFLAVAWTFDFFVTLGAVLGAVAVATLLLSIEARRRATMLATALLSRMGLRARTLYASMCAELAALAVVAIAIGLIAAWFVLAVASRQFDPRPQLSPAPVPVSLVPLAALTALCGGFAVAVAAGLAVRSALRAPVRELLRAQ